MLDFPFLILLMLVLIPLKDYIVIYGLLLFQVRRVISIMFYFLIITQINYGLFLCFANPKFMTYFSIFIPLFKLNSSLTSNLFNVIMGANSITNYFINFVLIGVLFFVFLVLIHLLKMANRNAKYVPSIILFVLCYAMCLFLPLFGLTP